MSKVEQLSNETLLSTESFQLAFLQTVSTWSVQLRSYERITPRWRWDLTLGILTSENIVGGKFTIHCLENSMVFYFNGLKVTFHFLAQSEIV